MTRSELIQKLAEKNPHLYLRDVETIVDTTFEEVTEALIRGDRVELRGFGTFSVKERAERTGRPAIEHQPDVTIPGLFGDTVVSWPVVWLPSWSKPICVTFTGQPACASTVTFVVIDSSC